MTTTLPSTSDSPALSAERALQQVFEASVQICRALQTPEQADFLLRSTIADLDQAIRTLRPTVSALFEAETASAISA